MEQLPSDVSVLFLMILAAEAVVSVPKPEPEPDPSNRIPKRRPDFHSISF